MTISDELLEKYLLGDATLFEVSQVKHAAENDPELAERLLVSGRFDKMMEDEEFEELPLQRMAAASQDNMCVIQCERYIIRAMGVASRGRTLLTAMKEEQAFIEGQADPGKEEWIQNVEKRFSKNASEWLTEKGTALYNIGRIIEENGFTATRQFMTGIEMLSDALLQREGIIAVVNEKVLLGKEVTGIPDHAVCVLSIEDEMIRLYNPSTGNDHDVYSLKDFQAAWDASHRYAVTAGARGGKQYNPHPQVLLEGIELNDELKELGEAIAEFAHDVWAEGKINNGYQFNPETNDDPSNGPLTHRDLRPYSELTESEKNYDREMSMNTLKLVRYLGYTLDKSNHTCAGCGKPIYLGWRYCSHCGRFLELSDFTKKAEK